MSAAVAGGGMQTKSLIQFALIGAGLYLLWKMFGSLKAGADHVIDAVAQGYVNLTSGEVVPLGSVVLPNGQAVAVSSLAIRPLPGTNSAQFSYLNVNYRIDGPSDANGNWSAVRM